MKLSKEKAAEFGEDSVTIYCTDYKGDRAGGTATMVLTPAEARALMGLLRVWLSVKAEEDGDAQ